jgi:hypothetical protein
MGDDLYQLGLDDLCRALTTDEPPATAGRELGVVQRLTLLITTASPTPSAEILSRCNDAFYRALELAVAAGAIDHYETVVRRLNLTGALLQRRQPDDAVELLSPRHAIDLFLHEVPLSAARAEELSVDWHGLDIADIRLLRQAKNLATPAVAVAKALGDAGAEMELWASILPQLP